MIGRRRAVVPVLGLLAGFVVSSQVRADGQVFLTSTRPAVTQRSHALPESVARLLTVLGDGERLSRLTRARLSEELPLGHVRALASTAEDGPVLLATGDGRAIDRALVQLDASESGALRELEVVLAAERPRALYEAMVARAQRERGAPRWRSDEAVLWCLSASASHPAWTLYVSLAGGEPSLRVTRESQDCGAL